MDTNSNIQPGKKIVSAEILHLDETGYGPKGTYTLREWRKECLDNFLAGKDAFKAWQDSWIGLVDSNLASAKFETLITYDDLSVEKIHNFNSKQYSLDFSCQTFGHAINCTGFTFRAEVIFVGATFNNTTPFDKAKFRDRVDFRHATFRGHGISFRDAVFDSFVDFEGAVLISNFMSYLSISFENSKFKSTVNFRNINFKVNTSFKNVVFSQDANFENTKYGINCNFEGVVFGEKNIFHGHHSGEYEMINFNNAEFMGDTKFNNSIFNLPSSFIKCKFFGDVEYKNACFHEDVRFFAVNFYGGSFFNDSIFTGNAVKRLGQMKRLAEDNGHTDQALNFNALELDAKAKLPHATIIFIVITKIYKIISDYGRSYSRPFMVYLILFFITLSIGFWNASQIAPKISKCEDDILQIMNTSFKLKCLDYSIKNKDDIELNGYRAAFEFAAYRGAGIIDFSDNDKQTAAVSQRVFGQSIEPGWARAWGIFKAIASSALLFLVALGLRNKYRIK